jgi:hypothetical protein
VEKDGNDLPARGGGGSRGRNSERIPRTTDADRTRGRLIEAIYRTRDGGRSLVRRIEEIYRHEAAAGAGGGRLKGSTGKRRRQEPGQEQ